MDPISKAQSQNSQLSRFGDKLKQFPKGVSGNPGGRPRKNSYTKALEKVANSKAGVTLMATIVTDVLEKRGMASVLMLREIGERLEGKVTESVEMNVSGNLVLSEVIAERRKKRGNSES